MKDKGIQSQLCCWVELCSQLSHHSGISFSSRNKVLMVSAYLKYPLNIKWYNWKCFGQLLQSYPVYSIHLWPGYSSCSWKIDTLKWPLGKESRVLRVLDGHWFPYQLKNGASSENLLLLFSSVTSDFVTPYGLQHTRLPCPSLTPRACQNSCPLSWIYHPTNSASVVLFSDRKSVV